MPTEVGTVAEIWRYPVKSMGGERLQTARVGLSGIVGDRGWAVRDEEVGEIASAKRLPELLQCAARYLEEPGEDRIPTAEIVFPGGSTLRSDDSRAASHLSELVGRRVSLSPIQPKENLEYYRRASRDPAGLERELREVFGLLEGEPLPDPEEFPEEFIKFASPPGTHFDASSLHLITTASLQAMEESSPGSRWDICRFRPNIVAAVSDTGKIEAGWCGHRVSLGEISIIIDEETIRCVMTTLAQGNLEKDPKIMRSLVKTANQNLGVYASIESFGTIKSDDKITIY